MASPRSSSPPALRDSNSATPPAVTRQISRNNPFLTYSDSNSSSSEDDDDILRPRGKMASRMQVRGGSPRQESEFETENVALPSREEQGHDGKDDDIVTARPRKLVSRRERSSTPESRPPQEAHSSPGLFVSPSKPQSPSPAGAPSDNDLPSPAALIKNPRFLALVEKKRKERLAREAEEARRRAERQKAAGVDNDDEEDDDDNITDDEGGRKLTQEVGATRPPRKASKKALEDMNRETQRLNRSLQLAHEAKVKKKIPKAALFERFNFKPEGSEIPAVAEPPATSSRAPTPGSAQQSDAEMKDVDTPPSSPPPVAKDGKSEEARPVAAEATGQKEGDDRLLEEFPTVEEIAEAATARKRLDKGKGKATSADLLPRPKRNLRVKLPTMQQANAATVSLSLDSDSDSDGLQIRPNKSKIDAIFDRVPLNRTTQPRSLQLLRKLAQLDDPDRKMGGPLPAAAPSSRADKSNQQAAAAPMTAGELAATLLQRARAQAKAERDRHLEMLRAKGVHVRTAEEREREEQEVEDIVARARRAAEELMEREREEARREERRRRRKEGREEGGGEGGEDPLAWDDSEEDEEWEGEGEEEEIELSGSEEEEEVEGEGEEEGEEEEEEEKGAGAVDDVAEESEEDETADAGEQAAEEDSDEEALPTSKKRRARKQVAILSDDEDEEPRSRVEATPRAKTTLPKSPSVRNTESPNVPTSVLRSATKTFIPGLPVAGPAGLGLTQIFQGTMDDSQMGTAGPASPSQPRPTFDVADFPDSNFSQTAQDAAEDMILDSQPAAGREAQNAETQGVQIRFSQSQMHGFDTLLAQNSTATQTSDLFEPSQDSGFRNFSPLRQRFVEAPVSTIETVKIGPSQADADADHNESPLVRRTGKLRRKADVVPASPSSRRHPVSDDGEEDVAEEGEDFETDEFGFGTVSNNAFAAMKEAALKEKKRKEAFDKKSSKAREMVEEQAEESEDEYAGLGGVDGEDSSDDDDHSVQEMIDDETKNDETDERKLAAFFADRERASDEKQVEKLFHDITTGMLRRKRHGDWDDLSDSDDAEEARRRMKRRQFAKMQRALFADERISKVAENPRNQAFLRTIEDRGSDDDMDFIFAPPPARAGLERQDSSSSGSRGQQTTIPDSQPHTSRPATNPRRAREGKRPSTLAEIRESLSNLLDEPLNSSIIPATDPGSSSEDDEDTPDGRRPHSSQNSSSSSSKENRHPRRTAKPTSIIDRVALKRNLSSTSSSSSYSTTGKLAFATGGSGSGGGSGIKVPALLRRATTNSSLLSSNTTTTTTSSSSSSSSSSSLPTHNHNSSAATATVPDASSSSSSSSASLKIKKPAGKRSGVSYLARENERRAALAEAERRREARKVRGMEGRGRVVGGLFAGGRFE